MSSLLGKKLSLIVLLVCLVFLAYYTANHLSDFRVLLDVSIHYLFLIAILIFLLLALNGLFLKFLIKDFGIRLTFAECISISVVTSFANAFLPFRGGAGFKAVYLKERYGFDYSYFIASHAASYLIIFNITAIMALGGLGGLYLQKDYINLPLTSLFLAICLGTSYAVLFAPERVKWVPFESVRETMNHILSGWTVIKSSRRNMLQLVWVAAANLLVMYVITYLEFMALGMKDLSGNPVGFLQSIIFSSFSMLSLLVAITPASLGIKESMLMFCSQFLGVTPSQALAVSILDRVVGFVVLLLLFNLASFCLKTGLRSQSARTPACGDQGG